MIIVKAVLWVVVLIVQELEEMMEEIPDDIVLPLPIVIMYRDVVYGKPVKRIP
jgi:hypothetical protein